MRSCSSWWRALLRLEPTGSWSIALPTKHAIWRASKAMYPLETVLRKRSVERVRDDGGSHGRAKPNEGSREALRSSPAKAPGKRVPESGQMLRRQVMANETMAPYAPLDTPKFIGPAFGSSMDRRSVFYIWA